MLSVDAFFLLNSINWPAIGCTSPIEEKKEIERQLLQWNQLVNVIIIFGRISKYVNYIQFNHKFSIPFGNGRTQAQNYDASNVYILSDANGGQLPRELCLQSI